MSLHKEMTVNKELILRIKGIKSTQKITKAMKMVATSKLKKYKDKLINANSYIYNLERLLANLINNRSDINDNENIFLSSEVNNNIKLIIVATSNRGLCGAFNSTIIKLTKKIINDTLAENKQVKIYCIGKKGYDQLKSRYSKFIINSAEINNKNGICYDDAKNIAQNIINLLKNKELTTCHIIYNKFKSVLSQEIQNKQLIPLEKIQTSSSELIYELEPDRESLLIELLPHNLAIQIYHALLENEVSEQASRMNAMENATKNAGDIINALTLKYNSSRQSSITKELIEIISGAEAV